MSDEAGRRLSSDSGHRETPRTRRGRGVSLPGGEVGADLVVVPSLNTARDVISFVAELQPGAVLRAGRQLVVPGGKPVNVVRYLALMGVPARLVATADAAMARELRGAMPAVVEAQIVVTSASTRIDLCVVDVDGRSTVINGPPAALSADEAEQAFALLERALEPGCLLVVAGSQPAGTLDRLLHLAAPRRVRLVLDASGADLETGLGARPLLVKVNLAELAAARGGGDEERAWSDGASLAPEAGTVVVTAGSRGARAWSNDGQLVELTPPRVHQVNAFGAGDAFTAGIVAALRAHRSLVDGLVAGAAWASAAVGDPGLALDPDRARLLQDQVSVKVVG